MKFRILFAAALTMTSALAGGEGWVRNFEAAKKQAADGKKDLLVDFTGSDWCSWRIKLNKEVFVHDAFKTGVKDSFVLVELDYPRDKSKVTEEEQKQNEALLKTYPIKGYPTILLCDADGKPFAATGYKAGGPETYVEQLNELRGRKALRDAAFAKAETVTGVERAKQLVAALDAMELDDGLIGKSYPDIAERIKTADPGDETGFTKKMAGKQRLAAFMQKLGELRKKQDIAGAMALVDETLAEKDLPVEVNQHIHGHKAAMLLHDKKPAEAVAALEEGIAVAPDSTVGKELTKFLEIARKAKEKEDTKPAGADQKE